MTLRSLSQSARSVFTWWPDVTVKSMQKDQYSSIKELILSYADAAHLCSVLGRTCSLRDLGEAEVEWSNSRPFGPAKWASRPAVVSILGHKDHGKTTLLDKIRGGNLAKKEEYGITQETYAFDVNIETPRKLRMMRNKSSSSSSSSSSFQSLHPPIYSFSFLDTPGHVSFSDMRSQVASISDVIILVVAADEGVLDQTFETLRIAKNSNVPLIVVINKCDLPNAAANVARIRAELVDLGATLHPPSNPVVSAKGDMVVLELSALYDETRFEELRSVLIEVTNDLNLVCDVNAVPRGIVVESMLAPGRGPVVRVNVREGTLKLGQYFVAENVFEGRVKDIRAMRNTNGGSTEARGMLDGAPSSSSSSSSLDFVSGGITVDIMGCIALPNPGTELVVCSSEEQSKLIAMVARNEIMYQDQLRDVEGPGAAERLQIEKPTFMQQEASRKKEIRERDEEEENDEDEYDEIEEVDELPDVADHQRLSSTHSNDDNIDDQYDDADDDSIHPDDVPVDLDPRGRVAPPLPARSSWELSPPPPPVQRRLPLANLRPSFKFYNLEQDQLPERVREDAARAGTRVESIENAIMADTNAASPSSTSSSSPPVGPKKFGLNILIKTANMSAVRMLRGAIDELNARNVAAGMPEVHVSYAAAGELSKKDLVNAEAEGCWVYGFRFVKSEGE